MSFYVGRVDVGKVGRVWSWLCFDCGRGGISTTGRLGAEEAAVMHAQQGCLPRDD